MQRRDRPTNSIHASARMIVTPFDPDFSEGTHDTGTTEQQPLVTEGPAETVAFLHPSSTPTIVLPILRPMRPSVGLSDKEIARLRTLAEVPTPQQPDNLQDSTLSVSRPGRPMSSPTDAETGGASLPTRDSETRTFGNRVNARATSCRGFGFCDTAELRYGREKAIAITPENCI